MQALFKPLFTSGLLTSHWLRQISSPDPESGQKHSTKLYGKQCVLRKGGGTEAMM